MINFALRGGQRPFQIMFALILALGTVSALWFLLALPLEPAHAQTLCVRPGGGSGCFASINAAISAAAPNDIIRVAAGTYQENVIISKTVSLQGGWNNNFSIRSINTFSSTITPMDNTMSVVTIQGQFGNTSAVVPTLDGFVISGGRADLGGNHGGGLSIANSNAVIISNTIQNNVAFLLGGGVWVQYGAPVLQGNRIQNNQSVGLGQEAYGGGVQLENTQAVLVNNIVMNNIVSGTQAYGGGLQISGTDTGQVTLTLNRFISNTALVHPSTAPSNYGYGGGIALNRGHVQLNNNIIFSNTAATDGGGIFMYGTLANCCTITGQANRVISNTAVQGGGVFVGGGVNNCCFYNDTNTQIEKNFATKGGGLFNGIQHVSLENSIIFSNTALTDGGGLLIQAGATFSSTNNTIYANFAREDGGAIFNAGSVVISNTTVSGNSANGMGGGIANFNLINMVNTTVANNTGSSGAGLFNSNTVNVKNSLIALNNGNNCLGTLNSLGNNLEDASTCAMGQPSDMANMAPEMNQLGSYGGVLPTHALAAGSPAIDAGDNSDCPPFDARGGMRPVDGNGDGSAICDIGAYEYGAMVPWIYLPLVSR